MKRKWYLPLAAILFAAPVSIAQTATDGATGSVDFLGEGVDASTLDKSRTIYQDIAPESDGVTTDNGLSIKYLRRERALAGDGCTVNKVINVVGVASAATGLQNLIDEDLTNEAVFGKGIGAEVTAGPLVSVRDANHYYSKGTTAGFCVVASSGESVLSLDVIKALSIGFYRDGKLIKVVPVDAGQNASGLTLSLINIGGSGVMRLTAEAPEVFDEISLDRAGGIQLDVAEAFRIKYAFAGRSGEHIMNIDYSHLEGVHKVNYTGGITKYNALTGRKLRLDYATVDGSQVDKIAGYEKFIEDPEESATLSAVVALGSKGQAQFNMVDDDAPGEEVFPAGTEVGFKLGLGGLLKLGVGSGNYIAFYSQKYKTSNVYPYNREYEEVDRVILEAGVLDVGVADIGKEQMFSAVSKEPFSGAKLFLGTGLEIDLGAVVAFYPYIKEAPELNHHCDLAPSSNVYLAEKVTQHQLTWNTNLGLPVEWTLESKPEGSQATVSADGLLSGIDKKGEYRLKIQVLGKGHEDCSSTVIVRNDQFEHGWDGNVAGGCADPLINGVGNGTYEISQKVYETSGSLISLSDLADINNIVDSDPDNYALYVGGLSIGSDVRIIGVKRTDGQPISDGSSAKRVGFVVEETTQGLNANLLQFLQIRCYFKANEGDKAIESKPIDESNAISAQVIGSDKSTKVRYSIEVPAGKMFDEIQLWTSGVLKLNASNIKIYYPFVEEANSTCSSLLGCDGQLINSHATVEPLLGGGVNIGQALKNVSYLIDNNYETSMDVQNTVSLGEGVRVNVTLGQTIDPSQQIGIIVDNKTFLAGVDAGNWLTVRLKKRNASAAAKVKAAAESEAESTVVNEFSDWHVVDAKVAGFGDKNVIYVTPSQPVDEIELEIANIAGVLTTQHFYGICTRGDSDKDGVPDCMDPKYTPVHPAGVESVAAAADSNLTVTVNGHNVTISCPSATVDRVIVYDLAGRAIDGAEGNPDGDTTIELPDGISLVSIILSDGTVRALKLAI